MRINPKLLVVVPLCFLTLHAAYAFSINFIDNHPMESAVFRLMSSTPFDGQKITPAPQSIVLTFSQTPRAERSYIKVTDMYGTRVDNGEVAANGMNISVPLAQLSPGKYAVKWSVYCRCKDEARLEDTFHFTVMP